MQAALIGVISAVLPAPRCWIGNASKAHIAWKVSRYCRFDLMHVMIDEPDESIDRAVAVSLRPSSSKPCCCVLD